MKNHTYSNKEVLDEVAHRLTCADCGHQITGQHSMTSKVTQEATCTGEGTKLHSCLECDYKITEALPIKADGHTYDHGCDPDCNACGAKREIRHVFGKKWETDNTSHWRSCIVCQLQEEKNPHSAGQTCEVCGFESTSSSDSASTEPSSPASGEDPQTPAGFPWLWLLCGGAVVCVISIILVKKKR